jgi:hypothetical protein
MNTDKATLKDKKKYSVKIEVDDSTHEYSDISIVELCRQLILKMKDSNSCAFYGFSKSKDEQ